MGSASIVMYVAIFIVAVAMVFVLVSTQTIVVKDRSLAIQEKTNIMQKKLSTDFDVYNIKLRDNGAELLLKNSGGQKMRPESVKLSINGDSVNMFEINHTMVEKYNIINSLLWDPDEILNITFNSTFKLQENNSLKISAENGKSKSFLFRTYVEQGSLIYATDTHNLFSDTLRIISDIDGESTLSFIDPEDENIFYATFDFGDANIYSSEIMIEHHFDSTDGLTKKDVEYYDGKSWVNLFELSNFLEDETDTFLTDKISSSPVKLRIVYETDNPEGINSRIDYFGISSNITRWWVEN